MKLKPLMNLTFMKHLNSQVKYQPHLPGDGAFFHSSNASLKKLYLKETVPGTKVSLAGTWYHHQLFWYLE